MPATPLALALALSLAACAGTPGSQADAPTSSPTAAAHSAGSVQPKADPAARFGQAAPAPAPGQAVAIFAGGCFWCMEKPFDHLDGVLATTSGYTDGPEIAPTYDAVSSHSTGHTEALRVLYDPAVLSYARLLDVFWHNIDPTQAEGQFCDKGHQYRSGIYTSDPAERALALASKAAVERRLGAPVATEIDDLGPFWPAEDYHQDFYDKDPVRYVSYRAGCGRDRRLKELWGEAALVGMGEAWVTATPEER
ncbi:peptide-methionine (S)-S-oxide reductase MsrA [Myxococcota bacterium]|nr:peptide-methionine (S)-S-oxide reductase MsrA [Myxococcota bacterium]